MAEYDLTPVAVPAVQTKYRTIHTALPVPESLPVFEQLRSAEPRSMQGQPPILWHSAENSTVSDPYGNRWIDWSSGVLITNIGHGHPAVKQALHDIIDQGLLATYVFPHTGRAELATRLQALAPDPTRYRVFLLSSGSEATENCIKLSKTYALQKYGPQRRYFVGFGNAFHGRTMGAQLAGGSETGKAWMVDRDPSFVTVPFPDGYRCENTSFDLFLQTLDSQGVRPEEIAGVMSESYQGGGPHFFPVDYAKQLETYCRQHDIVLTMDEVQAGFGRTGRLFTYEHYGITPDLIACGKGISSSLPISAVIGREDIMGLYAPGSMTSTHSGSPLPVAAALANLDILLGEKMAERAAQLGDGLLQPELARLQAKYPDRLGVKLGKGMVAGILVVQPGTKDPDPDTALRINIACLHRGLLMFAPVGAGECLKVAPPLSIPEDALRESLQVFEEAVDSVLGPAASAC